MSGTTEGAYSQDGAFTEAIHVTDTGRDRNAARATLGEGLAVSAFPLSVPV